MSVSREFVVNELKRLECSFYPDGGADDRAMDHLREAMRLLSSPVTGSDSEPQERFTIVTKLAS